MAGWHEISKNFGVKTKHYMCEHPSLTNNTQIIPLTVGSVDVSSMESLQKGFDDFKTDFGGKLDICVPCAGINRNLEFLQTSYEEAQKLSGVNFMGVYL